MTCQLTYTSGPLQLNVDSDRSVYLETLQKYLIFTNDTETNPAIEINLSFTTGPPVTSLLREHELRFENSIIDLKRKTIRNCIPSNPDGSEIIDNNYLLVRPLGALLQSIGYHTLHASLVCNGQHVLVFAGIGGCGKSSLSCLLALNGYNLLCDDLLYIRREELDYDFIPLRSHIKIANFDKKPFFKNQSLVPNNMLDISTGKGVFFFFPRYASGCEKLKINRVTKSDAFKSLLSDNLVFRTGQKDNRKGQIDILDFLHQLVDDLSFFEVRYNDQNLPQLREALDGVIPL